MKDRAQIKRWMQGLGLVYVLLICSAFPWQSWTERTTQTAALTGQGGDTAVLQETDAAGTKESLLQGTDTTGTKESLLQGTDTTGTKESLLRETDVAERAEKPKIAITFDDGPSALWTPMLLDGLKERSVKATFFLIGTNVEKGDNAEIVRRMQEEGHLIGNHTYHHVEITKVSDETALKEISMTNEVIQSITGEPVEYMRPPFGAWQKSLEERLHVFPVLWTVDPLDWTTENVDEIVNKVVTETEENDIILLHDCYQSSVQAALRIIDILQAEGYEFVTVDELIVD